MINQQTSVIHESTEIDGFQKHRDVHLLKRQQKEHLVSSPSSDDILELQSNKQTQTTTENHYFYNEISNNNNERKLYLEHLLKEYESTHKLPPTPPGILSKYNSTDSLSTLVSTDDKFNTLSTYKKYILNDTSSYSNTLLTDDTTNADILSITPPIKYSKQTNFLKPSMTFTGYQISGYKRYQVTVTLKTVNLPIQCNYTTNISTPHMSGFLSIKGLTNYQDEISTFFESFAVTDNSFGFFSSSWDHHLDLTSFDSNDLEHWLNFPAFKEMFNIDQFNNKAVNINEIPNTVKDYLNQRYIFMRWKEKFLIEDPDMDSIEGASFDGYYYVVHDQFTGKIQGFYYHKDAERFQQLELLPYAKVPGSSSYEFA